MHILRKKDVKVCRIVPIYRDLDLIGYARLIEPFGDPTSFLDRENGCVGFKQRWLIEWASLEECERSKFFAPLTLKERLNQISLCNLRTHHNVVYRTRLIWDAYYPDSIKDPLLSNSKEDNGLDDNFNKIF